METNRRTDLEPWLPRQDRKDRLGLPLPPGPKEHRTPLFRLVNKSHVGLGHDLYFVNDTSEVLISASTSTGGFTTADDDTVTLQNDNEPMYRLVQPGEGVKIREFDGYYDLDYLFQARVYVVSPTLGKLLLISKIDKGSIPDQVLLWDSLEPDRHSRVVWYDDEGNERQCYN